MLKKNEIVEVFQVIFILVVLPLSLFLTVTVSSLAAAEHAAGDGSEKEKQIQQLLDQSWALEGTMHKDKTALDQAAVLLGNGLLIDPLNDVVHWMMAEILFKKGDEEKDSEKRKDLYKKSIEFSKKSLELNPQSLEAHYWLGCSSARLADISGILSSMALVNQAKTELVEALNINPDNRFAVLAGAVLAAIYTEMPWPLRNLDKAREFALVAVRKDPNLTVASEKLAKVYFKAKQYDLAREEVARCLSIEQPTYVWDSILYDWPAVRKLLNEIENK